MELETPEIIDGQAMDIAGLDGQYQWTTMQEIPAQWSRLAPYLQQIPAPWDGVCYGVSHENSREGFRYLCGVRVETGAPLPAEFTTLQVPAQRYAVFPHCGHVSQIKDTFAAIWTGWLPRSGHRIADNPIMLERYGAGFDPQAGQGDITIWIPIQS